ncbi:CYFA0S04e00254g1_1 [Cyberlindnera fabianii]|uniref:CYFA0S04e00254g1_1 n=1 Tax=Cyberlindnera fabianii TaxID=36022 RepID=A0A061AWX0_CYBFA|nr:CYFA0S04e00254g1_1 [Cyberlindnera fabianii]
MDYQNRIGSKKGGGGVASEAQQNVHRKQRVSKLLHSQFDLDSDPYVFKNHLGQLECRLCLTTHLSSESYITHTQGRKHQQSLLRRSALDQKKNGPQKDTTNAGISGVEKKTYVKIGQPAYKVVKIRDVETMEMGMLITIKLPQLKAGEPPMHRFMSAFEQTVDDSPDKDKWQFLVIHGEPYENIAFKIEAKEVSREWGYWDEDLKEYYVQFFFKNTDQ